MNIQSNEEITLDKLYREIVESRNDLKGAIEASETTLLLKLESLNQKTQKLERENKILKEKIEALEKQNIKNNLVIFGLPNKHDEVTAQSVVQEINRLLQIELSESDINDVYSLGKGINKPIKVELLSFITKRKILYNTKHLKNTNIFISNDLTELQREEQKILRQHLKYLRENTEKRCYIKGNKLIIDSKGYNATELEKFHSQAIQREGRSQSPLQVITRTPAQEKKYINREPTAEFNNIKLNKPEASQKIELTLGAIKKVGDIAGGGPRTRNKSQK
ncbi:hypothetical protein WA026_018354 [Henosepilachna vigintioctopunctata]|uniref:Endonuclease-reverse transcriptase n=1 Tax=Henosepilachna vigintioctopunctata TaxID=420089 RepID=A0AAW1V8W0_9CUCU